MRLLFLRDVQQKGVCESSLVQKVLCKSKEKLSLG